MAYYLKDPQARIDYAFDWAAGYLAGQTVASSEWRVVPAETAGVEIVGASSQATRTVATVGGGVAGRVYRVTNRVVMSDGRADERTVVLRVEDR